MVYLAVSFRAEGWPQGLGHSIKISFLCHSAPQFGLGHKTTLDYCVRRRSRPVHETTEKARTRPPWFPSTGTRRRLLIPFSHRPGVPEGVKANAIHVQLAWLS